MEGYQRLLDLFRNAAKTRVGLNASAEPASDPVPPIHTPHEVSTVSQETANLLAPTPSIKVLNKEYLGELKASFFLPKAPL